MATRPLRTVLTMAREYQKRGRSIVAARNAREAQTDAARRKGEEMERRYIGTQLDLFGAPDRALYRPRRPLSARWGAELLRYNLADHVADVGVPKGAPLPRWNARAWIERAAWLASWDRWRASSECYERFVRHARELTLDRLHTLDSDELGVILPAIEATRHDPGRRFLNQRRVWDADELGELIVEGRNRRQLLALGRTEAKTRGQRFDLDRMPDHVLERLIQSHPSMELVDSLRSERERRAALTP